MSEAPLDEGSRAAAAVPAAVQAAEGRGRVALLKGARARHVRVILLVKEDVNLASRVQRDDDKRSGWERRVGLLAA